MASTNKTGKLNLSQYIGTDVPTWLTDYNGDMAKIDAGTLDQGTYDPTGVAGDAFRATWNCQEKCSQRTPEK